MSITKQIAAIHNELSTLRVSCVAVSKTKPIEQLLEAYEAGQRVFGENQVQELVAKHEVLPKDIEWHLVGHLQTNKVKYIAPFIQLIHSVDSFKLLQEINKQALKHDRVIDCLIQVYIADEDTKFGLAFDEVIELLRVLEEQPLPHVRIRGLMGIATNTSNEKLIKEEFYELKMFFDGIKLSFFSTHESFDILSMGMSSDYKIAIQQGSTMVRLGSNIFGERA